MKIKKRLWIFALLAVLLLAVAARIAYVNITAEPQLYERHAPETWVELGGSFIFDYEEYTDGYAVKANTAAIMTTMEFLERHDMTAADFEAQYGYAPNTDDAVVVAEVEIRNSGSTDGRLRLGEWSLLNDDYTLLSMLSPEMLRICTPELRETNSNAVSLSIGSDFKLSIPFPLRDIDVETARREAPYTLIPSGYPVRHELLLKTE